MEPGAAARLIVLILLLILSGFFSSAETAFTSLNRLKIKSLADEGSKRAVLVLSLIDQNAKFLSTILIGNNIVNIVASALLQNGYTIDSIKYESDSTQKGYTYQIK